MPNRLTLALHKRIMTRKRIWSPLEPFFLTYEINGQVYSRTYSPTNYKYNELAQSFDPRIPGVYFNPDSVPPLVLRKQPDLVLVDQLQQSYIDSKPAPPNVGPVQSTASDQSQTAGALPSNSDLIRAYFDNFIVGTSSRALYPLSLIVKTVNVEADDNNAGNIWVSGTSGNVAGLGQKLVKGQSISFGDLNIPKKYVDLSSIFVIGETVTDKVYVTAQIVNV